MQALCYYPKQNAYGTAQHFAPDSHLWLVAWIGESLLLGYACAIMASTRAWASPCASNPVPSAMNSLQRFDFQSCRLFFCTKNAPTPFLHTSTGVFHIAHIPYILSHFLALPSIQYNYLHIHPP